LDESAVTFSSKVIPRKNGMLKKIKKDKKDRKTKRVMGDKSTRRGMVDD
jgi:hypothetical protein